MSTDTHTHDVAVLGTTGYTGQELGRILAAHPHLNVAHSMTARADHEPPPPTLSRPAWEMLTRLRNVHGTTSAITRKGLNHRDTEHTEPYRTEGMEGAHRPIRRQWLTVHSRCHQRARHVPAFGHRFLQWNRCAKRNDAAATLDLISALEPDVLRPLFQTCFFQQVR